MEGNERTILRDANVLPGHKEDWAKLFISYQDISDRKKAENRLKQTADRNETLLQEIHHRVKNNMQMISSLLGLQSREMKDSNIKSIRRTARNRVQSMALIHQVIYESEELETVDVPKYVRRLVDAILQTFGSKRARVEVNYELEDGIRLPTETAIYCGLILNELFTNSLKYAFDETEEIHMISIGFQKTSNQKYELVVSDEGPGLPDNLDPAETNSLGLRLIHSLVTDQLKGEYSVQRESGTTFHILFDPKRKNSPSK